MSAETNALISASRCIDSCIPDGAKMSVLIYLLGTYLGIDLMDTNALINSARCIDSCIPRGLMPAVIVKLLNDIYNSGGGVTCGTADPTSTPAVSCGLYYRTDTGTVWVWDGTAWQAVINP